MSSFCPLCSTTVPSSELNWHVNDHFMEEDLIIDMELAQQIALEPWSPQSKDIHADFLLQHEDCYVECINIRSDSNESKCLEGIDHNMHSSLVTSQNHGFYYKVEGGIMCLLARCLEKESKNTSIITNYVDHYQSASNDVGWGCGWRNIQMLSSHLMFQRKEVKDVIFGGCGFVPDVHSLQRWLEVAWGKGFDLPGANSFGHNVLGSTKWIGTTECAALLRSFGLRARVVDFDTESTGSLASLAAGKAKSKQIYGPMDKFLVSEHKATLRVDGLSIPIASDNLGRKVKNSAEKISGPQILANWVWNYFVDADSLESTSFQNVLISKKTPLYFQHDGHSRTVVGIQRVRGSCGMQDKYTLLILDPGHRTATLERTLRENSGWQRFLKRGVNTLKMPQYQLCYVDPGTSNREEFEQLKRIDSLLIKL